MQLLVLGRVVVSERGLGMPEITNHGKLFFSIKTVGGWPLTGASVVRLGMTPARFNRPGSYRTQTRAEARTSGHGRCSPGSDGGAPILRPARRWQCAPKANAGSIGHPR